jgi:uncharacterized C2H2 Zn-finger protein
MNKDAQENKELPSTESLIATLQHSDPPTCQQALEQLVYLHIRHANDAPRRAAMQKALQDALHDESTFTNALKALAGLLRAQQERQFRARWHGNLEFSLTEIDRDAKWSWIRGALRERYETWGKTPNPLHQDALKLTADQDAATTAVNALTLVGDMTLLPELQEKGPVFHVPYGAPDVPSIFMGWPFHDLRRAIDYMGSADRGDVGDEAQKCPRCGSGDTISVEEACAYDERLALSPTPEPAWVAWLDELGSLPLSNRIIVVAMGLGWVLTIAFAVSGSRLAYLAILAPPLYFGLVLLADYLSTRFHHRAFEADLEREREWSRFYYCGRCDGVFAPDQAPLMPAGEMRSFLKDI